MTGDQTYSTSCSSWPSSAGALGTVNPASAFGGGLQFAKTAATSVYAVTGDGISLSFGPADYSTLNSRPDADVWLKGSDLLTLEALTWGGTRMAYNRVFYVNATKAGTMVVYACVGGVPTLAFDVPTTGTASFPKAGMDAFASTSSAGTVTNYQPAKSAVTLSADFGAKKVTITLHLIGTTVGPLPHSDTDLGTITGNGTIDATTGLFSGTWSSTDRNVTGNFAGSFFGPQAQEFGLTYSASGNDGAGTPNFVSGGTINGSR